MDNGQLAHCITLCNDFAEKAMDLNHKQLGKYKNHPKESGAVRRASMDLTRALAELRASK